MDSKYSFRLIVPAVLFGMVLSVPGFAQDSAPASTNPNAPAGQQMKAAGQDMENAGSDTVAAGTDTYHATKRAVKDTTITAEVKAALEKDKLPATEIHVHTRAGVVTLNGRCAFAGYGSAGRSGRPADQRRQEREQPTAGG